MPHPPRKRFYARPVLPPTSLPFQVRTSGRIRGETWHSTLGTYNDDYMLTVFLGGRGHYRRDDAPTMEITAGFVGLVGPQKPGLLLADPSDPYDHYYCRFNGRFAKKLARESLKNNKGTRFRAYPEAIWRALADLCARMGAVSKRPEYEDKMKRADALLAQALVMLTDPDRGEEQTLNARSIQEYLLDRINAPADLDAMATHFQVSKSHLCREAKKALGNTIVELFENMKVDWAAVLLRESNLRIGDVARHVGYADPYYFSRVFRKRMKVSPRTWRNSNSSLQLGVRR